MCGRTTSTMTAAQVAELLDVDEVVPPELPISSNATPAQPVYVAAVALDGRQRLGALRWGLVPSWAKGPRSGSKPISAGAETVAALPSSAQRMWPQMQAQHCPIGAKAALR
ncbi:MAG: SOS response-associated peptidase family protein [Acidimicrobiales bacterium]